jgi:glycosyltransferase involved in cell wall biosynthesis
VAALCGMPVALNVDGIERKRKKWNRAGQGLVPGFGVAGHVLPHRGGHRCAHHSGLLPRSATARIRTFIPYGAGDRQGGDHGGAGALGLEPGRYFLYVSRMEPENHPLEVRQAFERCAPMKLALVGDAPYAHDYIRRCAIRATRVVMPGAIYGEGYRELDSHCFAYIHATEVGGTHPALIEAMGRGALVLYRDTPENAEVAGDAGIPFGGRGRSWTCSRRLPGRPRFWP